MIWQRRLRGALFKSFKAADTLYSSYFVPNFILVFMRTSFSFKSHAIIHQKFLSVCIGQLFGLDK